MSKEVLQTQKQLLKDQIVETASRMVKDHDSDIVRGMTEIAATWITELDNLLYKLDETDKNIQQINIDNS